MKAGSGTGDGVEAQAAAWAVISRERELTSEERAKLDAWLAEGSRHLGAYVRAQATWIDLDRVVALEKAGSSPVPVRMPWPHWRQFAAAASIAVAVAAAGVAHSRLAGRIATDRGDVRQIALADGSTITLNGDSVLQVRFDDKERRIIFRGGEASFKVAHDGQRPFVVDADDIAVRAVGTEFAVRMDDDDVEVTVADGTVAVEEGSAVPRRYIRANEQFVAAPAGVRKAMLDPQEVERRLAWRHKLLIFRGQPLGSAAEEVNRYSDANVVIDDPTLARAEFIGVFRLGDARAFANAAAYAFNGEVVERDGNLYLRRKQYSPSH
ncbi:FecR family protein [Sphingosinicella rhizophila]|uniref:FecR domain-containing protein n=1 Tax=Sphingosinicella rhizophila TaxID=3050082 RepID=A0ABU3QA83_9SPHN|nr:FecR domain-containing protein [Sphingosinicella sp. GR2756]MDT9600311.1 FecR domain-containing protein [Sphingosinicella sp. GR2756]